MKNILVIIMLTIVVTVCFCLESTMFCFILMLFDYILLGMNIEDYINRND